MRHSRTQNTNTPGPWVQGSRVRPYDVRIGVLPLTTAQWRRVQERLASQALFRAKLLAGEMPHEIEEVFADCGTPLRMFPLPVRGQDLAEVLLPAYHRLAADPGEA
jgi:uncharacterized Zn finger protein